MSNPDPDPHPARLDPKLLATQCSVRFTRRSGPGGQNRNKVETAVVLVHRATGVGAEASERRSQAQNLQMALFRLRVKLALGVRRPVAAGRPPSALWSTRCQGGRIVLSETHDDFPAILAEALDVLHALSHDPKAAARALGCTSSQLIRLLKCEPQALLETNEARKHAGLHPLI
jgi:hypothetical protein